MEKRTDEHTDTKRHFSHRKQWSKNEDEELMTLSKHLCDEDISRRLGRTIASIWSRRKRLRQEGHFV